MADLNPYQSPDAEVTTDMAVGTGGRVYKSWHVGLATFLGTPLAGFWLMGTNYAALGQPGKRGTMMWSGIGTTVAVIALALVLPENFPSMPINIAVVAAMVALCNALQGEVLKAYVENKIFWYSGWRAAGVGLLFL
ncbi:MAG: hypothetical protein AAFN50_07645, partial [Pseudomonadota bacterium]